MHPNTFLNMSKNEKANERERGVERDRRRDVQGREEAGRRTVKPKGFSNAQAALEA